MSAVVTGLPADAREGTHSSALVQAAAIAGVTLPLAVLPWAVRFWPGQDNANNIAIAHVLAHYGDPGSPFPAFVRSNLHAGPYAIYYALLVTLGRLFGDVAADRLILGALIVALPLVLLALVRRLAPSRWPVVFLLVPMASGWALMSGILGFHLGFILGLGALAVAAPPLAASPRRLAAAACLAALATLCHPLLPAFIGIPWLALEGPALRTRAAWARIAAVFAPSALVLALSVASALFGESRGLLLSPLASGEGIHYSQFGRALQTLWLQNLVTLSWAELPLRASAVLLVAGAAIAGARRSGFKGSTAESAAARLAAAGVLFYFATPRSAMHWGVISPRSALMAVVLLAPAADLPRRLRSPAIAAALGLALSLAVGFVQWRGAAAESARLERIAAVAEDVPRGATLLPLVFDVHGASVSVASELHAWGHLTVERDAITPYLFAATGSDADNVGANFRPLIYRRPFDDAFLPNPTEDAPKRLRSGDFCLRGDGALPCADQIAAEERAIVSMAASYDRILALSPPPGFLDAARERLDVVRHDEFVWLFRPRVMPAVGR